MQTTFLVRDGKHETVVEVSLSYTLQPCCDKSPVIETVLSDVNGKVASQLKAGTFLGGDYRVIRPDKPSCEHTGEEYHSATPQPAHPAATRTKRSEALAEPQGQTLAAPPEDDPRTLRRSDRALRTTSNNHPTGKPDTDDGIAARITKKLQRGMEKLAEDRSPALWHPLGANLKTDASGSIEEVGNKLWYHAIKTKDIAHRNHLLSSFCRIHESMLAANGDSEERVRKSQRKANPDSELQRLHDNGATVLSWIVDGLYIHHGMKALLFYWASCKVGYMLASAAKLHIERRRSIAEKVVESLSQMHINVTGHAKALHPGIFLKYYNSNLKLSKICEYLGLINLAPISVSDSAVEDSLGAPVSLLLSKLGTEPSLNGQGRWLSLDDGRESDRPSKRQKTQHAKSQVELSPSPRVTTNDSPCAGVQPQNALGPYESGMENHPDPFRGGGIPTSTTSANSSECGADAVELPEIESLSPPVTGSGIPDRNVEGDRPSLVGVPPLELPGPGTTSRQTPPASADESGSDHSHSQSIIMTAVNNSCCAEIPAEKTVNDSNGHPGQRETGNLLASQDDQPQSPSTPTIGVSHAALDTAKLRDLGRSTRHAEQPYRTANALELPEAAHLVSPSSSMADHLAKKIQRDERRNSDPEVNLASPPDSLTHEPDYPSPAHSQEDEGVRPQGVRPADAVQESTGGSEGQPFDQIFEDLGLDLYELDWDKPGLFEF